VSLGLQGAACQEICGQRISLNCESSVSCTLLTFLCRGLQLQPLLPPRNQRVSTLLRIGCRILVRWLPICIESRVSCSEAQIEVEIAELDFRQ
jgi:hypothetical protein